jgi:hypothetical protein
VAVELLGGPSQAAVSDGGARAGPRAVLAILLLSAFTAPTHRPEALKAWAQWCVGFLLMLATFDLARSSTRRRALGMALAIGGATVAVLGLLETAHVPPVAVWLTAFRDGPLPQGDVPRLRSSLPQPNVAAMLFELTLPYMVVFAVSTRILWVRMVLAGLALTMVAALILTFSRAGLLASGAAGLLSVAATQGDRRWFRPLAGAGLTGSLALTATFAAFNPAFADRVLGELDTRPYQANYDAPADLTAPAGAREMVPVRLTNTGSRVWNASGPHRFGLGHHIRRPNGSVAAYDGPATPLPVDVPPGGSVEVDTQLRIPAAGTYQVEWDAVEESVTWFTWRGTPPGLTTLSSIAAPVPVRDTDALPPDGTVDVPHLGRLVAWSAAWRMLLARPFLGVGTDNFRWEFRNYSGQDVSDSTVHAHNMYLGLLADNGILGFVAFSWLSWRLARTLAPNLLSRHTNHDPRWALAHVTALMAWFAHGLLDDFHGTRTVLAFWLIVGLALASTTWAQSERQ